MGRAAGGQSYQFGHHRSFACYRCGSPEHMMRDCPHAYVTGTPTFSAGVSQPAAGASVSSSPANQSTRSGGQQGRGQRGRPVTQARLHAITPQECRDSPEVIMGTLSIFGWPAYTLFDPALRILLCLLVLRRTRTYLLRLFWANDKYLYPLAMSFH